MVVQPHFNDLVVGTYGRGFWIMDDITPLQQLSDAVIQSAVHIFKPRPAYRLHSITGGQRLTPEAYINYYLKDPPKDEVTITILDESGQTVASVPGTKEPGINRVSWNLAYSGARGAKLRTKPAGNPRVVEELRFRDTWEREGWYPLLSWGADAGFQGFLAAPGTYTVKLKAGDREFSEKLEVKKDPRSAGTLADIREQMKLQLEIRDDLNLCSDMISRLEWMRKELYDLKDVLFSGKGAAEMSPVIDEFDQKLQSVEYELFQKTIAEGDTKSFRDPQKIYFKLAVLSGDVSNSVDFAPNKQQREVYAVLKERLAVQKARFDEIMKTDLPVFSKKLADRNIPGIVVPEIK
jgi:hypothetical protein